MSQQLDTQSPEDRAEATARDLADRGKPVTARAVREAAGVRMTVSAAAARAWREATSDRAEVEVPEVPADVTARLTVVWADAYRAAVAAVTPERDRLPAEAEELRGEVEALTTAVTEVEAERYEAAQQYEFTHTTKQAAEEQLREANQPSAPDRPPSPSYANRTEHSLASSTPTSPASPLTVETVNKPWSQDANTNIRKRLLALNTGRFTPLFKRGSYAIRRELR